MRAVLRAARRPEGPEGGKPRFGPLDDGVSSGRWGYGKAVDTAFKYLANEGSFLVGTVRRRVQRAARRRRTARTRVRAPLLSSSRARAPGRQMLIALVIGVVLSLGPPPSMLD
jgi:hypothetical protein